MRQAERFHGGIDEHAARAHGFTPGDVADFSVNLNPYGPCPPVLAAAQRALLSRYPDPHAYAAREAWAARLGITREHVAVGHGAADLLWAVVRALVSPEERVVVAEPTFSEVRAAAAYARIERVVTPRADLSLDLELLGERARGARLVYLCSPNNPTGEGVSAARIAELAAALPDSWLVVDQSFLSLSDLASEETARLPENCIALRSLTKDFALAGLRIGYLVAAPEVVVRVEAARPTWATGAPALAAIACAAGQGAFVRESWARMRTDRDALCAGLEALGYRPLAGAAGYVLVDVGDAPQVARALLAQGVQVRDASSFGLPRHVRLAARPEHDRARLLAALGGG